MRIRLISVRFAACFITLGTFSGQPWAQQEATSEATAVSPLPATVELSLGEAVALVLERNLDIEIERYFPLIAAEDVVFERGEFDPELSSLISYTEADRQGGIQFRRTFDAEGFRSKNLIWNTGLRERTITGAEAEAGVEFSRDDLIVSGMWDEDEDGVLEPFRFHTEEYTSRPYFDLNQPLLQGFGVKVNTANLRIARNREQAAFLVFCDRVEEILAATQKAYWELVFSERAVQIGEEAVELAESFLRLAESRFRVGTGLETDVLQAQAQLAGREADLLQAQNLLESNRDLLRTLLRLTNTPDEWDVPLVPSDPPTTTTDVPNLRQCVTEAFANRFDYQVAKLDLDDREIEALVARNARYPVLDLFGTIAVLGLESNPGRSFETATDADFFEVTGGLRFSYPLGNHAARGRHRRALWEQKQAGASMELLEDQIVRQVREAWRAIETNWKQIEARERARVLAERKLDLEEKRYRVGRATSTDVLDFQEDLTRARVDETRARIDYLNSWIDLELSKGTVAGRCGVQIEGYPGQSSETREGADTGPSFTKK
jgi:outer membrane protein